MRSQTYSDSYGLKLWLVEDSQVSPVEVVGIHTRDATRDATSRPKNQCLWILAAKNISLIRFLQGSRSSKEQIRTTVWSNLSPTSSPITRRNIKLDRNFAFLLSNYPYSTGRDNFYTFYQHLTTYLKNDTQQSIAQVVSYERFTHSLTKQWKTWLEKKREKTIAFGKRPQVILKYVQKGPPGCTFTNFKLNSSVRRTIENRKLFHLFWALLVTDLNIVCVLCITFTAKPKHNITQICSSHLRPLVEKETLQLCRRQPTEGANLGI